MNNGVDLLRLLEPAVRPVSAPAGAGRAAALPFESQGFDELLRAAESSEPTGPVACGLIDSYGFGADIVQSRPVMDGSEATTTVTVSARRPDPLLALSDISRIENTTLRDLIARSAARTEAA